MSLYELNISESDGKEIKPVFTHGDYPTSVAVVKREPVITIEVHLSGSLARYSKLTLETLRHDIHLTLNSLTQKLEDKNEH